MTGGMCGAGQRPYLTSNNKLLGTGGFARAARGDGRLPPRLPLRDGARRRESRLVRRTSARGRDARRRPPLPAGARRRRGARPVAGVPRCGWGRDAAVSPSRPRPPTHRAVDAIRTQSRGTSRRSGTRSAGRSTRPTTGARGSSPGSSTPRALASGTALRIPNTDRAILDWTLDCVRHFGFDVVEEDPRQRERPQVRAAARRSARAAAVLPPRPTPRSPASARSRASR